MLILAALAFANAAYLFVWYARRALRLERTDRGYRDAIVLGLVGLAVGWGIWVPAFVWQVGVIVAVLIGRADMSHLTMGIAVLMTAQNVLFGAFIVGTVNGSASAVHGVTWPRSLTSQQQEQIVRAHLVIWFVTAAFSIALVTML